MTNPNETVAVAVRGWQVEWCRAIAAAEAHEVTISELLRGNLDERARAIVHASLLRRLRDGAATYLDERDLVPLGTGPVDTQWAAGAVFLRLRIVAIRRRPLPPVEEWPVLFGGPNPPVREVTR